MKPLTSEEIEVCVKMGLNPHEYIESRGRDQQAVLHQQRYYVGTDLEREARIKEAEQTVMKTMKISPERFRKMQLQNEAARLTCEEMEVCGKMGILPVDYLAEKMKAAGLTEHPSGQMILE